MYVDIVISNVFNLNKHFFSFFLSLPGLCTLIALFQLSAHAAHSTLQNMITHRHKCRSSTGVVTVKLERFVSSTDFSSTDLWYFSFHDVYHRSHK